MLSLLEVLEREHRLNGLAGLAARLCRVEAEWHGEAAPMLTSKRRLIHSGSWICFCRKFDRTAQADAMGGRVVALTME